MAPGISAADRDRADMLGVESYIDDLHGECEEQTQRIAELEQQLDDLRATVQELMGTASCSSAIPEAIGRGVNPNDPFSTVPAGD